MASLCNAVREREGAICGACGMRRLHRFTRHKAMLHIVVVQPTAGLRKKMHGRVPAACNTNQITCHVFDVTRNSATAIDSRDIDAANVMSTMDIYDRATGANL